MKKTKIILPALAAILVIGLMVGPALAYFTAHLEATGGAKVNLGFKTEIKETVKDMQKTVVISNKGPESVWVRAMAFSAYDLEYSGTGWIIGPGGYYYFDQALAAGESTQDKPLVIGIKTTVVEGDTTTPPASGEFNVVVIYECAPLLYDADGNPDPSFAWDAANWNIEAQTEAATEAATTDGGEG